MICIDIDTDRFIDRLDIDRYRWIDIDINIWIEVSRTP
jgi:hypothetical protein